MDIRVTMLQSPSVLLNGARVTFLYKKVEALLYYMLVNKTAQRSTIASLLWHDTTSEIAGKNLRHAIYTLKKNMGYDVIINKSKSIVTLNPEIPMESDYDAFRTQGNIDAYQGEFLSGFFLKQDDAYDDWVQLVRSELSTMYQQRLSQQITASIQDGDTEEAEHYAQRCLRADPLDESIATNLMQLYRQRGVYHKAVRVYQDLQKHLLDELGVAPLKETTALMYDIVNEWRLASAEITRSDEPFLIGRETAMKRITKAYDRFCSASTVASSCLLIGQEGCGKKYLMHYFLNTIDQSDTLLLNATCYRSEAHVPLYVWNTVLPGIVQYMGESDMEIPQSIRANLSSLFPAFLTESPAEHIEIEMENAITGGSIQWYLAMLLSAVCRKTKVLLVLEDIQFADTSSLELLHHLLRVLGPRKIMLLCSCSETVPEDTTAFIQAASRDNLIHTIFLQNFDREETASFIEKLTGSAPVESVIDAIFQASSGNAFVIIQLLNSIEDGGLQQIGQKQPDILQQRISSLRTDQRQLLDILALFSDQTPFSLLLAITGKEPLALLCSLSELKEQTLIKESEIGSETYISFAQPQLRDIVYPQISPINRHILHLRIANALRDRDILQTSHQYDQLSYHYREGGDALAALRYSIMGLEQFTEHYCELLPMYSGENAAQSSSDDELMQRFLQAEEKLAALGRDPANKAVVDEVTPVLLHAKGRYCISIGKYEEGLSSIKQLIKHENARKSVEYLPRAHRQMIFYGIQVFDPALMKQHIDIGSKISHKYGNEPEQAMYLRLLGLYYEMLNEPDQCRETLNASIALFSKLDNGSNRYILHIAGAHNYLGECLRKQGRLMEACGEYAAAIALNEPFLSYEGFPIIFSNYAQTLFELGQTENAFRWFSTAQDYYIRTRQLFGRSIVQSFLALFAAQENRFDDAAECLRSAKTYAVCMNSPKELGIYDSVCAKIAEMTIPEGALSDALEMNAEAYRLSAAARWKTAPSCIEAIRFMQHQQTNYLDYRRK